MLEYKGIKIAWLGHDGFRIEGSKTIYIDPFRISTKKKADAIFVTHEHYDDCKRSRRSFQERVGPKIAYMGKIINSRSARINAHYPLI